MMRMFFLEFWAKKCNFVSCYISRLEWKTFSTSASCINIWVISNYPSILYISEHTSVYVFIGCFICVYMNIYIKIMSYFSNAINWVHTSIYWMNFELCAFASWRDEIKKKIFFRILQEIWITGFLCKLYHIW